jgi:hypothetical protein
MKFSRFQKIRKFTSAKTWKFTLAKFRSLEIFSRVQKMGSSHPPKFRCSLSQIGEVHFAEFRSSEDCCITKHENRKVHFEHKNIEVHIILGSSLRTKDKTTRKFNSNMWKFAIFSEVHLPPPGSSFTSIRKFTPRIEVHI